MRECVVKPFCMLVVLVIITGSSSSSSYCSMYASSSLWVVLNSRNVVMSSVCCEGEGRILSLASSSTLLKSPITMMLCSLNHLCLSDL